ncbi:MAG: nickel pincer cofactor biosynthesis protein LarB, partial [Myxococcales bacterium]|nr:nickel pincer cofactor biosynthesis protein LarB [Myxococcales bacterium]
MTDLLALLEDVAAGRRSPAEAAAAIDRPAQPRAGFLDLGFAKLDVDRAARRGIPEVIFGAGKTAAQIARIARAQHAQGQRVLATRVAPAVAADTTAALAGLPVQYDADARVLWVETAPAIDQGQGIIAVIAAGTADRPAAAEAARVATLCGNRVETLHDVGVAGLHRLLAHLDWLRAAHVLIVCAGMEGALPSVVAGLVARPVIAVPT